MITMIFIDFLFDLQIGDDWEQDGVVHRKSEILRLLYSIVN